MRLRRSRTETYYHKKRIVEKDREGSTRESYGTASSVEGESWPASGKVQVQQYGERLNYIRNVRISGKYEVKHRKGIKMKNIKEQVYKALCSVTDNVSDAYPHSWAEDATIQYTEEQNSVYEHSSHGELVVEDE